MTTAQTIRPVVFCTYGSSSYARAFVRHLSDKIDGWSEASSDYRSLHDMIRLTCWDWFSGGDTAENVAIAIENALATEGEQQT